MILFGSLMGVTNSDAQIRTPAASPHATASSVVGLTNVSIDYYRPKVKGRKIFGEGNEYLISYGKIWRTGANSGTVISFDTDITMGGKAIKAGKYLVFTIPGADVWSVMLYSDISLGGSTSRYDEANEVAKFSVKPQSVSPSVETFTVNISDISEDNTKAALEIVWDNTSVKVPFEVNFDDIVMGDIEKNTQVNRGNYYAAANYYFTTGKDIDKALGWMEQYHAEGGQYWTYHLHAKMLEKKGDLNNALVMANKSLEMSTEAKNNDYVKLNQSLIESLKSKGATIPAEGKKKKKK